jgi:hypothetical protein
MLTDLEFPTKEEFPMKEKNGRVSVDAARSKQ